MSTIQQVLAEVAEAHRLNVPAMACTCGEEVGLNCDGQTYAEHLADEQARALQAWANDEETFGMINSTFRNAPFHPSVWAVVNETFRIDR